MRKILLFLLIFMLWLTLSAKGLDESKIRKIEKIIQAEVKFDLFSGSILVASEGKIVYADGFGDASKEYQIPNKLETRFNISSIQKTFIGTTIMMLVQEGKLGLTDSLSKYFPDCPFPDLADKIQVQHLLNNSSGLGGYRRNADYQRKAESFKSINEVLPFVFKQKPASMPGKTFRYSNSGFLLLKAIIEKITGMKFATVVKHKILDPLGMKNTVFFTSGTIISNRATGHAHAENETGFIRITGEPSAYAGGGIYTTVLDLLRFDQALYDEGLLKEKFKQIMFTPVGPDKTYAFGWFNVLYKGARIIFHGGASGGYNSEFRRYPENKMTLIVLSNYQDGAFEITNRIEAALFGWPYKLATRADFNFLKGMSCQNNQNYSRAIDYFKKNINTADPHLPSLYQCARSRILGEFDQKNAIEDLNLYIKLADNNTQPSVAAAWWRKGVAFEQLKEYKQAIKCYRRSLKLDPAFGLARESLNKIKKKQ
jgi:CubicO group peptidase (beta-lactamase class C family)